MDKQMNQSALRGDAAMDMYSIGGPSPIIEVMTKDYQDLECLRNDSEESKMNFNFPQASNRLLYAISAICACMLFLLIILVIAFRYPGETPDRVLQYQIGNLSNGMNSKVDQLSQDGTRLMEKLQKLENIVKEMQEDTSISAVHSTITRALSAINRLSDRVKKLQVNGSEDFTCPSGWQKFQLNCYFYASTGKSWTESKKACEEKDSHMIVINTDEEQNFAFGMTKGKYTWIGLTDVSGNWKWVDGTKYSSTIKNWIPGQPDEYFGHGLGGGEDCAHLHGDGKWNDDHCSRPYNYLCEMDM
ncbi:asialoglycoprotein receptor 1-like [Gastrophryne carolinensis]